MLSQANTFPPPSPLLARRIYKTLLLQLSHWFPPAVSSRAGGGREVITAYSSVAMAAEACVSAARKEKVANVDDYLSRFISPPPLPPPCRDSICVVNILKGSPLLFLPLPFIYSFFITIIYFAPHPYEPPSPPPPLPLPARLTPPPLNCLTPKIQISQLWDPVSFLKNEHITSYAPHPTTTTTTTLSNPTHRPPLPFIFSLSLSPLPPSSLFVTINISIYMQIIIY